MSRRRKAPGRAAAGETEAQADVPDAAARRHVEMCLAAADMLKSFGYDAYVSTHRSPAVYRELEKASGRTFWGIAVYSSINPKKNTHLKDPDVVAVYKGEACYFAEIKWGAAEGVDGTDMDALVADGGWADFLAAARGARSVRVLGPKVESGSECEDRTPLNFRVARDHQFIVVTDLHALALRFPESLVAVRDRVERAGPKVALADWKAEFEPYRSLEDHLIQRSADEVIEKMGGNFFQILSKEKK